MEALSDLLLFFLISVATSQNILSFYAFYIFKCIKLAVELII